MEFIDDSFDAVVKPVHTAWEKPGSDILVAFPRREMAQPCFESAEQFLRENGVKKGHQNGQRLDLSNGSTVRYRSTWNADMLRGLHTDLLYVYKPEYHDEEFFEDFAPFLEQ